MHPKILLTTVRSRGHKLLADARDGARQQANQWSAEMGTQVQQTSDSLRTLRGTDRTTLVKEIKHRLGRFMRQTFVEGPTRLLRKRLTRRATWFMALGLVPIVATISLIGLPTVLFNSPEQRAYFFFARTLETDPLSLWPLLLGIVSLTVALRFTLREEAFQSS